MVTLDVANCLSSLQMRMLLCHHGHVGRVLVVGARPLTHSLSCHIHPNSHLQLQEYTIRMVFFGSMMVWRNMRTLPKRLSCLGCMPVCGNEICQGLP